MQKIYQAQKAVIVCLGPDNEEHLSKIAIDSIIIISYFLCQKLGTLFSDLSSNDTIYYAVNKEWDQLPLPNGCEFSTLIPCGNTGLVLFALLFHAYVSYPRNKCEYGTSAILRS
jgi:hypothetical protein